MREINGSFYYDFNYIVVFATMSIKVVFAIAVSEPRDVCDAVCSKTNTRIMRVPRSRQTHFSFGTPATEVA